MSEFLQNNEGENPSAKQWGDLAEQIASHSTVDGGGDTVYLGRDVDESERAKVEESGFDNPGESPRGSYWDREISEEVYPQLEGESDYDYQARLDSMRAEVDRDLYGDTVTDVTKAYHKTHADYKQGRVSYGDDEKAFSELTRAMEDRSRYRGVSEEEALEIAKQFGDVESKNSRHIESPRGSHFDREISEEVYPQLEGESDYDYQARLDSMKEEVYRDLNGDALTDAAKAYHKTHADFKQGRVSYGDIEKAGKKLDLTRSLHEKGKI